MSAYSNDLGPNSVNSFPLSPLSFLKRTADVYPNQSAVIYGRRRYTWAQIYNRCLQLASALRGAGVGKGDTVAFLAANTPEMIEAHFGVPMVGAVLCAINTRLDPGTVAFMLDHAEVKVLVCDTEYAPTAKKALALIAGRPPLVIDIEDPQGPGGRRLGRFEYEDFIAEKAVNAADFEAIDEWQPISLNYTSGTTGNPKGVVYHHRGAYLAALSNMIDWDMPRHAVFLWTLPIFHCNGWCFVWTLAANAATQVCMRRFEPQAALVAIRHHRVTHYCGAPVIHAMLALELQKCKGGTDRTIHALLGGAPPHISVVSALHETGVKVRQIYGLTEVFGPAAVCAEQPDWASLEPLALAEKQTRQGVRYTAQDAMTVLDPQTMLLVPNDGKTVGEVMFRGNTTMLGYLKNPAATQEAFAGGWFHSGDLAVVHPDGYIQIKDRAKDVIISGGENINSLEVEEVLLRHPLVLNAAVVASPHPKWGETPCAFIELKPGATATADELIEHCRGALARFKVPTRVIFGELPKTATGKIQKFQLKERARDGT